MTKLLPWIILVVALMKISNSTLSDTDHHLAHNANATSEYKPTWIAEASSPEHHPQFVRNAFVPSFEGLLARYYASGSSPLSYRNPHFLDREYLHRKQQSYHHLHSEDDRHDYRSSPYQDHHPMHSVPEYDVSPLKKHDYAGPNYGGWDMFPGGGGGLNLGSGFGQLGQAAKKGKEAKALFILMAPLILLAVFGPFLATQAMLPWVANGGLSSVSTIASGSGKRRKRRSPPLYDPRQTAELEKRLRLFLEVQDFIARSGSTNFAEEIGEAFLRCQKYTERRNKCLERIACEYTDETSVMDPAERRIAKMVFQNVMSNPMIPASIKGRLSKGSMFGKNNRSRCRNYWCEAIDGSKAK